MLKSSLMMSLPSTMTKYALMEPSTNLIKSCVTTTYTKSHSNLIFKAKIWLLLCLDQQKNNF